MRVERLDALEILDSRGQPTLQVSALTGGGAHVSAGVPAGASTGRREAAERRDGDTTRYAGRGVHAAVAAVVGPITEVVCGRDWADLAALDDAVCAADGTPDLSRFGANAVVGVSMTAARGFAANEGKTLYRYLTAGGVHGRLPVPHFNVINGGAHTRTPLAFQEFMIAPIGAPGITDAIRAGAEIYASLRAHLAEAGFGTSLGDEGGFAPEIDDPALACELLLAAITAAGYRAGPDGVMIALDPAANGFSDSPGRYRIAGQTLTNTELVDLYAELVERFPIWSIEDGCAEDDDSGWQQLTDRLGQRTQLVGDDLFVTDAPTITAAAQHGIANAVLLKVNQVGTVTGTMAAAAAARRAGYASMVSHRSGETTDTFIADLAVGIGCGQLKAGAPARGERVAKYNRLLEIAAAEPALPYGLDPDTRMPA